MTTENTVVASSWGLPEGYPNSYIMRTQIMTLRVQLAELREPDFDPNKRITFSPNFVDVWANASEFGYFNQDQQVLLLNLLKTTAASLRIAEPESWLDKEIELCFS